MPKRAYFDSEDVSGIIRDAAFAAHRTLAATEAKTIYLTPTASWLYVTLPDATLIGAGAVYTFYNEADPTDTSKGFGIKDDGGTVIATCYPTQTVELILTVASDANGSWEFKNGLPSLEKLGLGSWGNGPLLNGPQGVLSSNALHSAPRMTVVAMTATRAVVVFVDDAGEDIKAVVADVDSVGEWSYGAVATVDSTPNQTIQDLDIVRLDDDTAVVFTSETTAKDLEAYVLNIVGNGITPGAMQTIFASGTNNIVGIQAMTLATNIMIVVHGGGTGPAGKIHHIRRVNDTLTNNDTQTLDVTIAPGDGVVIKKTNSGLGVVAYASRVFAFSVSASTITVGTEEAFANTDFVPFAILEVTNPNSYLVIGHSGETWIAPQVVPITIDGSLNVNDFTGKAMHEMYEGVLGDVAPTQAVAVDESTIFFWTEPSVVAALTHNVSRDRYTRAATLMSQDRKGHQTDADMNGSPTRLKTNLQLGTASGMTALYLFENGLCASGVNGGPRQRWMRPMGTDLIVEIRASFDPDSELELSIRAIKWA